MFAWINEILNQNNNKSSVNYYSYPNADIIIIIESVDIFIRFSFRSISLHERVRAHCISESDIYLSTIFIDFCLFN